MILTDHIVNLVHHKGAIAMPKRSENSPLYDYNIYQIPLEGMESGVLLTSPI